MLLYNCNICLEWEEVKLKSKLFARRAVASIGLGVLASITLGGAMVENAVSQDHFVQTTPSDNCEVVQQTQELKRLQETEQFGKNWYIHSEHTWHLKVPELKTEEILQLRTEFNRTKNGDMFNKYLPYRNSIKNNQEKLSHYEEMVRQLEKQLSINFLDGSIPEWESGKAVNMKPSDSSSCYLIAASIVDLLHNRPELLIKTSTPPKNVEAQRRSEFVQFPPEGHGFAIWFYPEPPIPCEQLTRITGHFYPPINTIVLENETFWNSVIEQDPLRDPLHEFLHALDGSASLSENVDGLLPEMSGKQEKGYKDIRHELFDIVVKRNEHKKLPSTITVTGLPAYAFRGGSEFLAVTTTYFHKQPEILYKASPKLYKIYRDYFKIDPLNGYKDLE